METKPTRYPQDKEGSPQTVISLKRRDGTIDRTFIVLGIDGTTFRIVLDDKHRKIRKGESLQSAVRRFRRGQTERIWPKAEYPGYEIL